MVLRSNLAATLCLSKLWQPGAAQQRVLGAAGIKRTKGPLAKMLLPAALVKVMLSTSNLTEVPLSRGVVTSTSLFKGLWT